MKKYVIIAGANGAGKSTFYATAEDDFESIEKVNFNEIVRSIGNWTNASDRVKAGRVVVEKIDKMFSEGCSFSQETTLCGKSIRNNIHKAIELGYFLELHYIGLDSPDMAKNRVKQRVDQGGHGISDTDIERRYYESLQNLKKVLPLSDIVTIYDNTHKLTMIAVFCKGECVWSSKTKPQWYIDLGIG